MNNTKSSSNNSVLLFIRAGCSFINCADNFSMNKINSINEQIENETVMLDKNKLL